MLDLIYQFTLVACPVSRGVYAVYLAQVSRSGVSIQGDRQAWAEGAYYSGAYWIVLIVFGIEIS